MTEKNDERHGNLLTEIYYKDGGPGSYSSKERLLYEAQKVDPSVTRKEVSEFMDKQYTHSRHQRLRWTYPTRKVLVLRIDKCWTSDLVDVISLKNYNGSYSYVLTCMCVFSRYLWTRPLKQKTKQETEEAMSSIIRQNNGVSPYKLWTDNGTEWTSLKSFYEKNEIIQYSTNSERKAVFIERCNLTIEALLYSMMTSKNTANWVSLLPEATRAYNSRVHSSLFGHTPEFAHQKQNEEYLRTKFLQEYERHKLKFKNKKPKFRIGDRVRIAKSRTAFGPRGYEPRTYMPIETVTDILRTYPIVYKLAGKKRNYYEQELAKASDSEKESEKKYFIEKTRVTQPSISRSGQKRGGIKQYLLKARNRPDISTWITADEVETLKKNGYIL